MEKRLTNGMVNITGLKMVADREVQKTTLTYRPRANYAKGMDVNQQVYELMITAAYDMLEIGHANYRGDFTAAELAGQAGYLPMFTTYADADELYDYISIETKTFCCGFHAHHIFQQIAEWEGVMNLSPKKYYRFTVEGKEMPKDVKLKPYSRCHGYKPRTISYADTDRRIAKKFEVLGKLYESLTSEGMRRALSVIEAAYFWDKASYELRSMARRAMEWKLWKDYGREPGSQPVHFSTQDFQPGPEIWKQVDEDYVIELRRHFQQMLDSSPAPEWPKQGDVVMLKGRENMAKKYQGKFLCEGLVAMLSTYGDRIEWRALVRTKKYDCEYFYPAQLEPAPEKPKKKTSKKTAKPAASNKKHAASNKKHAASHEVAEPSNEMTLAERLREALLKQFKQAA